MARIPKVCSKNVMSFLFLKDQVKIEYKDKNIELALSDFKPKTSTLSYEHIVAYHKSAGMLVQ